MYFPTVVLVSQKLENWRGSRQRRPGAGLCMPDCEVERVREQRRACEVAARWLVRMPSISVCRPATSDDSEWDTVVSLVEDDSSQIWFKTHQKPIRAICQSFTKKRERKTLKIKRRLGVTELISGNISSAKQIQ